MLKIAKIVYHGVNMDIHCIMIFVVILLIFHVINFLKFSRKIIKKYLEKREKLEEMCRQFGHNFDGWTYHEWNSIKKPTQREYEWYRECSRCGCIEKTKQNPVELKNTAYIRRK